MNTICFWNDGYPFRTTLPSDVYFTFGSNLRGRHGTGAAIGAARYFGAQEGIGEGFTGQSYAIPTKDKHLIVLPLSDIAARVRTFIKETKIHDNKKFFITPIGCGRAGYRADQIAPLFYGIGINCAIPLSWCPYFKNTEFLNSGV